MALPNISDVEAWKNRHAKLACLSASSSRAAANALISTAIIG